MYMTILKPNKSTKTNIKEILEDPLRQNKISELEKYKKITFEIEERQARQIYERRGTNKIHEDIIKTYKDEIKNTNEHYKHFTIPKKSNPKKRRKIDAPDAMLSKAQQVIKVYLEEDLHIQTHKAAHAYVKDRSTVTAMKIHQLNNSKWFLQIDLKDLFNSINKE